MISTAVAPGLCKVLEAGALDPYSAKNVQRVIDLAEQVEASIGTDSNKFQVLCCSWWLVQTGGLLTLFGSLDDFEICPHRF